MRTAAPSTCTGFDEVAYEAHWERKESVYRVSFFALGATRSGCRWLASGAATADATDHRHVAKKGLPCAWVRPATSRPGRLFCRRLVVKDVLWERPHSPGAPT
jgi:hypothetical protein